MSIESSIVYSVDGEYYNYEDLEEAVASIISYRKGTDKEFKCGDTVVLSKGICRHRTPSDYFGFHDAMDIIEQIQCNASDEVGKCADDMYYVEKDGIYELETLVQAWANKNMNCTFYAVEDTSDFQVVLEGKHFQ
jgi:hypothetical protein